MAHLALRKRMQRRSGREAFVGRIQEAPIDILAVNR
jgi:hypothetical protein